ncbi:MAG: Cupin [Chthoniobacter sp.]|jgi:quercetin dioxygenase-like cupin family protein|nr:Cupin [Chthoniobacter sp.]
MTPSPIATFVALLFLSGAATAQKPEAIGAAPSSAAPELHREAAENNSERKGVATVLHRDDVLRDRGAGRHLWPLLNTPEARMNYFEVTGRGPLHYHPDADHRLYVLEGAVLVTCGSEITKCIAGDFIIIPKGVRHCYDVPASGEKALLLTFDAPPYDPKKTVNVEPKPAGTN